VIKILKRPDFPVFFIDNISYYVYSLGLQHPMIRHKMMNRRGLLKAALGCVTTPYLGGCSTTGKNQGIESIGPFLNLLSQTMRAPDGKRDEIVIAMAYEYYRRHSGNKEIQGTIEETLRINEVTLQQAQDIWEESQAKARNIIAKGDQEVVRFLSTHQRQKREERLADLATKKDAAIKSGDLAAARNHAFKLLEEGGQIVNGKLMLSFSNQNPPRCLTHLSPEPTRPGELCYTGGIPIKDIDLAQLDPHQMNGNDIGRVPYIQGLFLKQHPKAGPYLFNSFRFVPGVAPQ
jgi:hypothetical protein